MVAAAAPAQGQRHTGELVSGNHSSKHALPLASTDWPENALRHSFASYHLAHFKNAADTALQLGHHDSRITFAHYRELVKPKEAERYWNIKPAATEEIVPLVTQH